MMRTRTAFAILLFAAVTSSTFAFGGREEENAAAPERRDIVLVGSVIAVREIDADRTDVTIATDAGPEVTVEVPTRMAGTLRIAPGDKFQSRERVAVGSDERLRVLEFEISRGR